MSATSAPSPQPTSSRDDNGDLTFNIYGYDPSLAPAIVFMIAFALLTLVQIVQVARSRIWWLVVLVIGGVGEIIGWGGRLWAWSNPYELNAFLLQIIALILAPCFFSAVCYGLLGMIVRSIGQQYSLLKPWLYLTIFCTLDLIAIVIQAVGGAMAAIALKNDDSSSSGTHIMVAGICVQLAGMIAFLCLALDVWRRARRDRSYQNHPHPQQSGLRKISIGLVIASFWILVRCCYRVAELAEGWSGYLITHEVYFCVLDSMCMVFAQLAFTFAWPANEKRLRSDVNDVLPRASAERPRGGEPEKVMLA